MRYTVRAEVTIEAPTAYDAQEWVFDALRYSVSAVGGEDIIINGTPWSTGDDDE